MNVVEIEFNSESWRENTLEPRCRLGTSDRVVFYEQHPDALQNALLQSVLSVDPEGFVVTVILRDGSSCLQLIT
jgi:hypothetical protein